MSLGALALFVIAFVRKAYRDLMQNPPEHRGNDLALAIMAGLSLVVRLLPLWVGVGLAAVIVRRIVLSVTWSIHGH